MAAFVQTTVKLKPKVYRALKKRKIVASEEALSAIVNEALWIKLREDDIDRAAARKWKKGRGQPAADVLRELRRDGIL